MGRFKAEGCDVEQGRMGVLGGTFDPIHIGHLVAAEGVREELRLDRVVFVPAARPPHKDAASISDGLRRLEMARLATTDNPAFEVSDLELRRGGTSYTIDTVRQLKAGYGSGVRLFFLMGVDSLREITMWKDCDSLLEEAVVVVFPRPGLDPCAVEESIRERVRFVSTCEVGVASSGIRERVRAGKSIRYLVHPAVEAFIHREGLYR